MAKIKDFRRGDTKHIKLSFNPLFYDITGWKFFLSLKKTFDDPVAALAVVTTVGDHPADDIALGIVNIVITSAVSKTLTPGKYFIDIQRVIAGNPPNVLTIYPAVENYKETISIIPDVTLEDE